MRNSSHTLISQVKHAVNTWRRREQWSRESVVAAIVEVYEKEQGQLVTGLSFSTTADIYQRSKNNADRLYRWMDDDEETTNLLPTNFLPYVFRALPMDLRLELALQLMTGTGLTVRIIENDANGCIVAAVAEMAKESGEGIAALVGLNADSSIDELNRAHKEVSEGASAHQNALDLIDQFRQGLAKA